MSGDSDVHRNHVAASAEVSQPSCDSPVILMNSTSAKCETRRILLTGGTGYVGGRLLSVVERRSCPLRLLARRPSHLRSRVSTRHEIVEADVNDETSLDSALEGVHTAYYLIHSMGAGEDFEAEDRRAARNFARAARRKGVERIIYLGGLGDESEQLSPHLRSRHEVGRILKESGAMVVEFRASIIIGSGSLSFELIRSLVEKLPVMICPRWVSTPAQPIAIEDVLSYLDAALDLSAGESRIYEIGGPDEVSYADIMQEYAHQRNLARLMISVPVLSPRLSSLWLGLVTPIYARIGRTLVESLRNPTIVQNRRARDDFDIVPMGLTEAIHRALANEDRTFAQTRWQDAVSSSREAVRYGGEHFGNRLVDSRSSVVEVSTEQAFAVIEQLGGQMGWHFANWLWKLRGFIDLLVGGPGLRRGRRHPSELTVGDTVDCWRVEEIDPPRSLRLFAEMRLPGRAWLEFEVSPHADGAMITQTAVFDPVGLSGLVYWYGIYPLHQLIFAGMLRGIAQAAKRSVQSADRMKCSTPTSGRPTQEDCSIANARI